MEKIFKAIVFIPMWIIAVCWHAWMILTFRPDFKNLSDTKKTIGSFAIAFYLIGILRHTLLDGSDASSVFFNLTFSLVVTYLVFSKKGRSSSLFSAVLGGSVAIDLLVVVLYFASILGPRGSDEGMIQYTSIKMYLFLFELVVAFNCYRSFNKQDSSIKAAGYKKI